MAKFKVLVSSTCYDFNELRSELRPFIESLGHEPVMSEYADIFYDPRIHTHLSCLNEVGYCDAVVVVIGSRFGGIGTRDAQASLNYSELRKYFSDQSLFDQAGTFSITQLEALTAVEKNIPVYVFVDRRVMHDHHFYSLNQDYFESGEINYPSIEKPEYAGAIFKFIDQMRNRVGGNMVVEFDRLEDIRHHLKRQLSYWFQSLVRESREKSLIEAEKGNFLDAVNDMKAILLSQTQEKNQEIVKLVLEFRTLIDFLAAFKFSEFREKIQSSPTWDALFREFGITNIIPDGTKFILSNDEAYFIESSKGFYCALINFSTYKKFEEAWGRFCRIEPEKKESLIDACLNESLDATLSYSSRVRYIRQEFASLASDNKLGLIGGSRR